MIYRVESLTQGDEDFATEALALARAKELEAASDEFERRNVAGIGDAVRVVAIETSGRYKSITTIYPQRSETVGGFGSEVR